MHHIDSKGEYIFLWSWKHVSQVKFSKLKDRAYEYPTQKSLHIIPLLNENKKLKTSVFNTQTHIHTHM